MDQETDEAVAAHTLNAGERICNLLAGASVLSWGVLGIVHATPGDRWSTGRISISALHFVVGGLFLARRPLRSQAGWGALAACVPSFIVGGIAFKLASPCELWPVHAQVIFAVGAAAAGFSLATLGRSFAVLPAFRGLVASGPYRIIRHPAYASELVMLCGFLLAAPSPALGLTTAAGVLFMVLRITVEEQFLSNDPEYMAYRQQVGYRLIPGVW